MKWLIVVYLFMNGTYEATDTKNIPTNSFYLSNLLSVAILTSVYF